MNKMNINMNALYKGCILSSIAHAIMVAHYPELSNEHSWDGYNYNVNDNQGIRGTITFMENYCIGAFRDENSNRLNTATKLKPAKHYFKSAPKEIIEMAQTETLQYLLENYNNSIIPIITTSFWCNRNEFHSEDTFEQMWQNGLSILNYLILDINEIIEYLRDYYEMTTEQIELLMLLFHKRLDDPTSVIKITREEMNKIGTEDKIGLEESKISFAEMSFILEY